jgi:DNA-binding MarR family transcriptional regulator
MQADHPSVRPHEEPSLRATEELSKQEYLEQVMNLIEETAAVHLLLQRAQDELHGHSELTRACRSVLRDLYRSGPQTVPRLARGRLVPRQNVQQQINVLLKAGYVELFRNPDHKRSPLVRLTPVGRTTLEQMWSREQEALSHLDLALSPDDLQLATQVLRQLRGALEQRRMDREA